MQAVRQMLTVTDSVIPLPAADSRDDEYSLIAILPPFARAVLSPHTNVRSFLLEPSVPVGKSARRQPRNFSPRYM